MRRLLKNLLGNWIIKMSNKFGSRPNQEHIHEALTKLHNTINVDPGKRGIILEITDKDKFVVFSDQHKGARNFADDFMFSENNYLHALEYYYKFSFHYINLGDSEELWENLLENVIKHNKKTFEAEKKFINRNSFTKVFGNHDLYWDNDPLAGFSLNRIYGVKIPIYEGIVLKIKIDAQVIDIFLTHGHQGDLQSDGNWFSKWFVSNVWGPFQSFLQINPNTPAYDNQLKTKHNQMMYSWVVKQQNTLLITGHTHQPVFTSLTHLEQLYVRLDDAKKNKNKAEVAQLLTEINKRIRKGDKAPIIKKNIPLYFNSGCCCFSDGDITGIEIENGKIRLIKWSSIGTGNASRYILEEASLSELIIW